ncbi:hypothetical protein CXB49_10695 [Chromobacterium sp. ATCC 53434]|uniref:RHS repeat-associated core domain-containing protein n=1 Tax=Chromobacterium sp. (strain ATCC 53434 / SC 14030) TaxID=2059672 RepID=UPI000C78C726|nr:RHS repeat-associated core domain-containing protein [Chromobacterium sp. ATCC 53434]AUH51245.1 hypothetical protein CXB49_10695 [Chromobacterium sp. ATCC 53434]
MNNGVLGFNGERLDPVSGAFHLGNGYRTYNPALMRFHCPDNLSPFGAGGINLYAYCAGDSINRADPSGHLSWQAWTSIGLGVAGLALAAFTAGTSIIASGGVIAALESASAVSLVVGGAAVLADVTAIASGATEENNPAASAILGWASIALGISGVGGKFVRTTYSVAASIGNRLMKSFARGLSPTGRSVCINTRRLMALDAGLDTAPSRGWIALDYFTSEQRAYLDSQHVGTGAYQGRLYRGDSRPPQYIFKYGFLPKGSNRDMANHFAGLPDSAFVSFTKRKEVAANFAGFRALDTSAGRIGFIYKLDKLDYAADLTASSLRVNDYAEVVALSPVPGDRVKGAYIVRFESRSSASYEFVDYIKNPEFDENRQRWLFCFF